MKLTAKTDLEVPAAAVFATLIDHPAWEREAVRNGVEIQRPADAPAMGVGAEWRIRGHFRGKARKVQIRVEELTQDQRIGLGIDSPSVEGTTRLEVMALSARRSRLRVDLEVKAASQEAAEDIVAHLTEEKINAELILSGLPAAELVSDPHVVSPEDDGSDKGVSSPDTAPKPKHHHIPHPHPDLSHHARHAPQPHWKMPGGIWRHHEMQQPKHDPTKLEKLGVNVDGVGGVYRAFAVPFFDETQVFREKVVHEGTSLARMCSVCQLVSVSPYS